MFCNSWKSCTNVTALAENCAIGCKFLSELYKNIKRTYPYLSAVVIKR
jgi:hypothetical protein